jgi:hypothetical protein
MSEIVHETGHLQLGVVRSYFTQQGRRLKSVVEFGETLGFHRGDFAQSRQVLDDFVGVSEAVRSRRHVDKLATFGERQVT